jgi:hypothetical protein
MLRPMAPPAHHRGGTIYFAGPHHCCRASQGLGWKLDRNVHHGALEVFLLAIYIYVVACMMETIRWTQ